MYEPTSGTNLPAVLLVHGGAWRDGDKLGQTQIDVADFMRDRGLVVFVINYRLTCVTKPIGVSDGRLCQGRGHGTADTTIEPYDDMRDAVVWVRQHASDYAVNSARVGVLGLSAGGNLAALAGVQGTRRGQSGRRHRDLVWGVPLAVVSPLLGVSRCITNRERYIGCVYDYTPGEYRSMQQRLERGLARPPVLHRQQHRSGHAVPHLQLEE
ncbi:MAG: alpha/beta hydrolase [Actinobacteria bacterium]|nr:alpha/beta hydrolase [Actinomycetota bacterium]